MLRRMLWVVAGLFGAGLLLAVGAVAWFMADLRGHLERSASAALNRPVNVRAAGMRWNEGPTLRLEDLRIANPPWAGVADMVRIGSLDADISLTALLRGVLRYDRLVIRDLAIDLARSPDGERNWRFAAGQGGWAPFAIVPKDRTQVPVLIDCVLERAAVTYRDPQQGVNLPVRFETLSIRTSGEDRPVALSGKGSYKDTALDLDAAVGSFVQLWDATLPFPMRATIATAAGTIALDGESMLPLDFDDVRSGLQVQASKAGQLLQVLGATGLPDVELALAARLERNGDRWHVPTVDGKLAGSTFTGTVDLVEGAHAVANELSLTLRFPALDLGPLLGTEAGAAEGGSWRETPGEPGPDRATNIDATLAAARLRYRGLELADVELSSRVAAGKVLLRNASAHGFGGRVTLSGSARRGVPVEVNGRWSGLDASLLAGLLGTERKQIAGRLAGEVEVAGSGKTMGDLVGRLRGHGYAALTGGRIGNALLEEASADLRALFQAGDGWSTVDCFLTVVQVQDGIAALGATLRTKEVGLSAGGRLDLGRERVDITVESVASGALALSIPLRVRGDFRRLSVQPSPGAEVPRAGAADPDPLRTFPGSIRKAIVQNACAR